MMTILRDTKDGSVIDATELSDLRTLVMGKPDDPRPVAMPGYVYNLSYKIVSGNRANAWWTGGTTIHQSLGNLFAGSSADHMERLIGKWFLGLDHPTAVSYNSSTVYGYQLASGSLFQGGVSYTDVSQGNLGDCYFLAALAGTAFRTPAAISSMFIDNGDNTWTVRFYNGSVADYVTVDRFLPTNAGFRVYAGWGGGLANEADNELWVALAEKAYAQINEEGWIGQSNTNAYQEVDPINRPTMNVTGINGGWSDTSLQHITARTSHWEGLDYSDRTAVINAFNAGRIVFLNTHNHALTLVGYNATTQKFRIYNPWGHSDEFTWDEIIYGKPGEDPFLNWSYTIT
jgi:hypothetical protein